MTKFATGKYNRAELVKCISQCFQSYPEIMGIFRMVLLADDTRERLDNRELRFCLRFQKLKVLFEQWTLKRFAIPATFMYKLKTAIKTGFYGTLGSTFAVRATEILSQLIRSDTNITERSSVSVTPRRSSNTSPRNHFAAMTMSAKPTTAPFNLVPETRSPRPSKPP